MITPVTFQQHALSLQALLRAPLVTEPRQILEEIVSFQRDLSDAGHPSPHLDAIAAYFDRLSWGDDICHQVCDGVRALLQIKALHPAPQETWNSLHSRYLATLGGQAGAYEFVRNLTDRDLSYVDQVLEKNSGRRLVRKTFETRSTFGLASSGFFNEARFPLRLGRRSALPALDYGVTPDKKPFLVLESMEGDLRSVFDPSKPRDIYREATKLSSLLLRVHFHHVIHRDIKPGNILVDAEGSYYLADFGLALLTDELEFLPQLISRSGTPAYMPPEARDETRAFTPNFGMDVYAMGMTILETVTGRYLPANFSGKESISKVLGVRDNDWMRFFRRVLEKDGNAQWQLERLGAIVDKATSLNPATRYPHGGALFRDIHDTLKPGRVPIAPMVGAIRLSIEASKVNDMETVPDVRFNQKTTEKQI